MFTPYVIPKQARDSRNVLHYFLVGAPGVGKTTLLLKLAKLIPAVSVEGFFTQEIREQGRRVGFRVETFSGHTGILAHVNFKTGPPVGKYRVDVAAFERIGVQALERALEESGIILIDEIGKMELFSRRFQEVLGRVMEAEKPVVATVMARPHPFVDSLKARPDLEFYEVTLANRDTLAETLRRRITVRG